jgi:hypothetical protein
MVQSMLLTHSIAAAQTAPEDFAIRFEWGVCFTDVVDTFDNVVERFVRRDLHVSSAPSLVSQQVKDAIYKAIIEARFFEYPSEFRVKGHIAFAPAPHYRLVVRNAGRSHSVFWHDSSGPSTDEADRLRLMFTTIEQVLSGLPELNRLPIPNIGCA